MSKYQIEYEGYLEPDEYDTEDEAIAAADEMVSNSMFGAGIIYASNPGDAWEENSDYTGEYWIVKVDEYGNEIDRFQP